MVARDTGFPNRKERLPHGRPRNGRCASPEAEIRLSRAWQPACDSPAARPISGHPASTRARDTLLCFYLPSSGFYLLAVFVCIIIFVVFFSSCLSLFLQACQPATNCYLYSVLYLYSLWIYIIDHYQQPVPRPKKMPPRLPPTPAASGELHIKDHPIDAMAEHSFALPPAALSPVATDDSNSNSSSRKASVVFQTPVSPASPDIAGRRMSTTSSSRGGTKRAAASAALDEFNLPPPPTRARKIIQMKPKTSSSSVGAGSATSQPAQKSTGKSNAASSKPAAAAPAAAASSATTSEQSNTNTNASGSKKKQPSATSAAGRKIARKTAHSLIERRRRSKMNEEFSTLKDMIPACRGQEMHKLAILQVSTFFCF